MDSGDPFGLFRMILDEYSAQILQLTTPKAMNALELSDALGIPIAACYRRIRALKDVGILKEEGKVQSLGGKMVSLYRSSVEKAEVVLEDGRLKVLIDVDGQETTDEMLLTEEATMLHWERTKTSQRRRNAVRTAERN
ncbi:MAG: helix-turn-helix transcriptional regulator [Candidatus Thermoplasmatota archaeon]|nr:helix-turn-helix transcriptional regulator [Candidatus Thermoplasmatota archaeon]